MFGELIPPNTYKRFHSQNSDSHHKSICELCEKGMIFPALLLALRSSEVDAMSLLLESELTEDGFGNTKSRFVGNYLHRRTLNRDFFLNNPNHPKFIEHLMRHKFKQQIEKITNSTMWDIIDEWKDSMQTVVKFHSEKSVFSKEQIVVESIAIGHKRPNFTLDLLNFNGTCDEVESVSQHIDFGWKWTRDHFSDKIDLIKFNAIIDFGKPKKYFRLMLKQSGSPKSGEGFHKFVAFADREIWFEDSEATDRIMIGTSAVKWFDENLSKQIQDSDGELEFFQK